MCDLHAKLTARRRWPAERGTDEVISQLCAGSKFTTASSKKAFFVQTHAGCALKKKSDSALTGSDCEWKSAWELFIRAASHHIMCVLHKRRLLSHIICAPLISPVLCSLSDLPFSPRCTRDAALCFLVACVHVIDALGADVHISHGEVTNATTCYFFSCCNQFLFNFPTAKVKVTFIMREKENTLVTMLLIMRVAKIS